MRALLALALAACGPGGDDTADTGDTAVEDTDFLTALPADPRPLAVSISGHEALSFSFTREDCVSFDGSGDLRQRWFDDAQSWVLTIEIADGYAGAGLYESADGARIQLMHSVAQGAYYSSAEGSHAVTIDVDLDDGTVAAGDATADGLTDAATGGTVTLSPATLPLWCDGVTH